MDYQIIRKKFISFFEKNKHMVVSSSSLIPAQDPTILFTNAGMNQFKDCFLGAEKRSYNRATSIQKCVRAGGKHNDLDQVGFTQRHLTFFEMMGNFSFGDYFKQDAIKYAWTLLIQEFAIPCDKLRVTVFNTDDEAAQIWQTMNGLSADRITRLDEASNFWQMGDTGPCGPCTEIYYDRGSTIGCKQISCAPGCECDRFIEIWNLVFMQYDRQKDGTLKPLTQTGVDTGMGFERLCMVLQGKQSVFEIDIFEMLIRHLEHLSDKKYQVSDQALQAAFHVLVDHVRSSSLLIADGCSPSNDGRGYVLRKIIRRAALFAQKLSSDRKLFASLASVFIESMKHLYPELATNRELVISIIQSEIDRFSENLLSGQSILQKYIDEQVRQGKKVLEGHHVFKLYDTYGFPPELTKVIAGQHALTIDERGFEQEMVKQQEQSGKKAAADDETILFPTDLVTEFVGYTTLTATSVVQYVLEQPDAIWLCLKECSFYVESGGQVHDSGFVMIHNQTFKVLDLKKVGQRFKPAIMIKIGVSDMQGHRAPRIAVGDSAFCSVDQQARANTVKNHTATHLLQAALRQVLGTQVGQAGSLVNASYLRFDFSHHKPMTHDEIKQVEDLVNQKIQEDIKTNIYTSTLKEAQQAGAMAFFGEKYNPDSVRVVEIPGFSTELCGGTHVASTGVIGCFKITSEAALATGTRRMIAVTGPQAIELFRQCFSASKQISDLLKIKLEEVAHGVANLQEHYHQALSVIKQMKKQAIKQAIPQWIQQVKQVGATPFLYLELEEDMPGNQLKQLCQDLSDKAPGFYFIVNKASDRFAFVGFVSKQYQDQLSLKDLSAILHVQAGLKGGGDGQAIQGGGQELPKNLRDTVVSWLERQ